MWAAYRNFIIDSLDFTFQQCLVSERAYGTRVHCNWSGGSCGRGGIGKLRGISREEGVVSK